MESSVISINIVNPNNKILTNEIYPILFYWDGESDVINDFVTNQKFKDVIAKSTDYVNAKVAYTYFINDTEKYENNEVNLQDIIDLSQFDSKEVMYNSLVKHFNVLYKTSMKMDLQFGDEDNKTKIILIYNSLKTKFGDRVTKPTIVNWCHSVLVEEGYTLANVKYIINFLNNILINEE